MKKIIYIGMMIFMMCLFCSCGSTKEEKLNSEKEKSILIEKKSNNKILTNDLDCHSEWVINEDDSIVEFSNSVNRKNVIIQAMEEIGVFDFNFGKVDYVWDGKDFLSVLSLVEIKERKLKIITSFDGKEWTVESISEGDNEQQKVYYSTDDEEKVVDFQLDDTMLSQDNSIRNQYPKDFLEIYDSYVDIVEENVEGIIVNELVMPAEEKDEYVSYNISFEKSGDEYFENRPEVSIGYYEGKMSDFTLSFEINEDPEVMKELVVTTVAVGEKIDYSKAAEKAKKLLENYEGAGDRIILKLNNCKYIMQESEWNDEFGGDTTNLEVVFLNKITSKGNKEDYQKLSAEMMKSAFNKGTKGYITAKVVSDDTEHNELLVMEGKEKFILYYDSSIFAGEFDIGEIYTFYGEVAQYKKGFSGYLRIDFFE